MARTHLRAAAEAPLIACPRPPPAPIALENYARKMKWRRGYKGLRPDWTVPQAMDQYSPAEHETWRTLYRRQRAIVERYAAPEFVAHLDDMRCADAIPAMSDLSDLLFAKTGWRVAPVPGLVEDDIFFAYLAERCFPATWWIRHTDELDYIEEPDVFHDLFGHAPLLFHPPFARFLEEYGKGGLKAKTFGAIKNLAALYWYTVEFGLVQSGAGVRAFGAGMLSSSGETKFSVDSQSPNRIAFDLGRVLNTDYWINRYQSTYFVIDSFDSLIGECVGTDFSALYDKFHGQLSIKPSGVMAGDAIIQRGAQDYERGWEDGARGRLRRWDEEGERPRLMADYEDGWAQGNDNLQRRLALQGD